MSWSIICFLKFITFPGVRSLQKLIHFWFPVQKARKWENDNDVLKKVRYRINQKVENVFVFVLVLCCFQCV